MSSPVLVLTTPSQQKTGKGLDKKNGENCFSQYTPLSQPLLQEQRIRESSKVGREEEGLSSNRPELVALRECLEAHEDHVDLLYLTDSEASLQAIQRARTKGWYRLDRRRTNAIGGPRALVGPPNLLMGMSCM